VVVGLGLRPDLISQGFGQAFVSAGPAFARDRLAPHHFRVSVAAFNRRAIARHERVGFVPTRTFDHATNGGVFSFVEMERPT
jgi:ribosomal-protein-alanine N-acetyltransferase